MQSEKQILTQEECEKVLHRSTRGRRLVNYTIRPFSDEVVGFLAQHFRLTIESVDLQGIQNEQNFFMKSLPLENKAQRDYIMSMNLFEKEGLVYKNLISEFLGSVSESFAPKCYFYKSDQCIVLEDMASENFWVNDFGYWSLDSANAAIKTLARFHAASIIFEESRSLPGKPFRINEHYPLEVTETSFAFEESKIRYKWLINLSKCLKNFSALYTTDKAVPKKLEDYLFSEQGFKAVIQPSTKCRNVLCHDDLWSNNFLFNDKGDCRIVDFQMIRYCHPMIDILQLLYLNLERNVLNSSIKELIGRYHEVMRYELQLHGLQIENLLPEEELFASVPEYTLPALIESSMFGTNVFISKEMSNSVVSSFENIERFNLYDRWYFVDKELKENPKFKERMDNVLVPLFTLAGDL